MRITLYNFKFTTFSSICQKLKRAELATNRMQFCQTLNSLILHNLQTLNQNINNNWSDLYITILHLNVLTIRQPSIYLHSGLEVGLYSDACRYFVLVPQRSKTITYVFKISNNWKTLLIAIGSALVYLLHLLFLT